VDKKILPPPFKIKSIEPIRLISRNARKRAILEAGFNTFELQSIDVFIDLLTDSGTSAMSDNQWAGMMLGDEAYAGSKNFTHLKNAINDVYGFPYVIPTHQGRGAEHIMSQALIKKGDWIPNNLYFTTRRAHQELAGGIWHDVSVTEAIDTQSEHPFKGCIDTRKLLALISKAKKERARIPYISMEACVNMAGGQPFAMKNIQAVRAISKKYRIPIYIDATRLVENAYFIRQREKGYQNTPVKKIVQEICSFADGVTVSAKKDALVNIGGFIALRDKEVFQKMRELVVVWEGLHTYGGLAGRDLEAMARGIQEMTDDDYIAHRVGQVKDLGEQLQKAGVPIVKPVGGHAVFLDAKLFAPHIPQYQFPAQALAAAIYVLSGVRTMERGIVSGQHGDEPYYGLELVRLTIPRRVYTREHLDYVANAIILLHKKRAKICGLKMIYAPKTLRFFQARFEKI
jgi:tyrosine phenol-lyase